MKRSITTALLLLPAAVLFAQTGAFTLKGSVANAKGGEKAFLLYKNGADALTDSAALTNGAFEFKGTIANPVKATLLVGHSGEVYSTLRRSRKVDLLSAYLEPGVVELKGTDSIYNAKIMGGTTNKEYVTLQAIQKPFDDRSTALYKEEAAVPKEKQTPELEAEYEKRSDAIDAEKKVALGAFIKAHPASWVSLGALQAYGGYFPEYSDLEPFFNKFPEAIKNSEQGKYYAALIPKLKLIAIGAQAPVFAQADKDGKLISVESFRGKYLLIDFWASWCGPCRHENPNVVKAYAQFKDKNFTILGVSLDQPTGREKWLKAIADDGLTWTEVTDLKFWKNEAAVLYGVQAIPQNFLIDPQGRIIAKNLTGKALTDKLAEVTASAKPIKAGTDK